MKGWKITLSYSGIETVLSPIKSEINQVIHSSNESEYFLSDVPAKTKDLSSWIDLGNLFFDSGRNEQAIVAYSKALEIDSKNVYVLTDLGVMYRRTGKITESINAFNMALKINPDAQMAMFNKGIVFYYDLGNITGALDIWNELLLKNPDFIMPTEQRLDEYLSLIK